MSRHDPQNMDLSIFFDSSFHIVKVILTNNEEEDQERWAFPFITLLLEYSLWYIYFYPTSLKPSCEKIQQDKRSAKILLLQTYCMLITLSLRIKSFLHLDDTCIVVFIKYDGFINWKTTTCDSNMLIHKPQLHVLMACFMQCDEFLMVRGCCD